MDTIERFEKDRVSNGSSIYKIFTAKGFKRILLLMILISLLNIIYVLFYKLSENNLNSIFEKINSRLTEETVNREVEKTI